jgi:hypothetical protein
MTFKKGDLVLIGCDDRSVEGHIILASDNQESLMLGFEAILDGHVGMMPVLLQDGVYRSIVTGQAVAVMPRKSRAATLYMWTVYDHPADMPNAYVARLWKATDTASGQPEPTDKIIANKSLDIVRDHLRKFGLTCLARSPGDDPKIVEVWL